MKLLNFAIVIFRLNIIFVTAKFAQCLKNSNSNHVTIANRFIVYLNDIKNFVIKFSKNLQRYSFVQAMSRSQMKSWSKKARTIIFSSFMIIRLTDVQLNKSRWRRSTSRQNYWLWVESRRRESDEDDFSSQFNTT